MSLFSTFKRALGFGAEDFESDIETDDPVEASEPQSEPHHAAPDTMPAPPADDPLPADILEGVVELFNSIQPEFVKQCIDTEAQKRFLLESIDSALRSRIQAAIVRGHDLGLQQWEEERQSVADEITELRNQKKELEQKRDESRNARLSAERQKRALNERVHDLENQVLTLEAEKEQLHLENRSMLNKLRVAGITGSLTDGDSQAEKMLEEVEQLKAENGRLEGELSEAHSHIDTLTSRLAAAETDAAELARLRTRNDELSASADKSASLAESLRTELEQAREEIESLRATIASNLRAHAVLLESIAEKESDPVLDVPVKMPIPPIEPEKPAPKKKKKKPSARKKEKPRISAIDELMDSTDWLVAPTPEPPKETPREKEDDFGYQAPPPKKQIPDDDRQLSLW